MDFTKANVESAFNVIIQKNEKEIQAANLFLMEWQQSANCHITSFEIFTQSENMDFKKLAILILYRNIQAHWFDYDENFRSSIREFFLNLSSFGILDGPIKNTSISIIVLIGLYEWPDKFPPYFDVLLSQEVEQGIKLRIISEFLNFLEDCEFITRQRLYLLRVTILNGEYLPTIFQLIEENQNEESVSDCLSIFNSIFIWSDNLQFLTPNIMEFIISTLPNKKSFECLHSLFVSRSDCSQILTDIFPLLVNPLIENPNLFFLLPFLRKYGRMLEKIDGPLTAQLYVLLLSQEIDADDMDDFWNLWHSVCLRIFQPSLTHDITENVTYQIFQPIFENMRACFFDLLPYTVNNCKILDQEAVASWDLLVRIDTPGFYRFFGEQFVELQQLVEKLDENEILPDELNYAIGSFDFFVKTDPNPELLDMITQYFSFILAHIERSDVPSVLFAISRCSQILNMDDQLFQTFFQLIIMSINSDDIDHQESAANSLLYTICNIPHDEFERKKELFIPFLQEFDTIIQKHMLMSIPSDSFLITMIKVATLLSCKLTANNPNEGIDTCFFDKVADTVLSLLDDFPPTALKLITEIGYASADMCFIIYSKFWDILFQLAIENDKLIIDLVLDAISAGIVNCPYEQIESQIKSFIEILLNKVDCELAFSAISICRSTHQQLDQYYQLFEPLAVKPSAPLFQMFSTFSYNLINFDTAIPLICMGISDVDLDICGSALKSVKLFLSIPEIMPNLLGKFNEPLIQAVVHSLTDFVHCTLLSKLSSILFKMIHLLRQINLEKAQTVLVASFQSQCIEPVDEYFETFASKYVGEIQDESLAKQAIADLLIMLKYSTPKDQKDIFNELQDFEDTEKVVMKQFEEDMQSKNQPFEEFGTLSIRKPI